MFRKHCVISLAQLGQQAKFLSEFLDFLTVLPSFLFLFPLPILVHKLEMSSCSLTRTAYFYCKLYIYNFQWTDFLQTLTFITGSSVKSQLPCFPRLKRLNLQLWRAFPPHMQIPMKTQLWNTPTAQPVCSGWFSHLRFLLAVGALASWTGHNIQLLTWLRQGELRLWSFCSMLFYMLSHLTTLYLFLAQTLLSLQRLIQNLLSREVFADLL